MILAGTPVTHRSAATISSSWWRSCCCCCCCCVCVSPELCTRLAFSIVSTRLVYNFWAEQTFANVWPSDMTPCSTQRGCRMTAVTRHITGFISIDQTRVISGTCFFTWQRPRLNTPPSSRYQPSLNGIHRLT